MNLETAQQLYEKYPVIFFGRNKSIKKSISHCELEIGNGWFHIINALCEQLYSPYYVAKRNYEYKLKFQVSSDEFEQFSIQKYMYPHDTSLKYKVIFSPVDVEKARLLMVRAYEDIPMAHQIKEKFGSLRFYVDNESPITYSLISMAENLSDVTCEICGDKGQKSSSKSGWIKTLCEKHQEKN